MPPTKVQCPSCESSEIIPLPGDDELVYRCKSASESEIDSRSGCGQMITHREFTAMRSKAGGSATKGAKGTVAAVPTTPKMSSTPSKPLGSSLRRPLSSLHSNTLNRNSAGTTTASPLQKPTEPTATADSLTPPSSTSSDTVKSLSPAKPAVTPPVSKATPKRAVASDDDDDDDDDEEDEEEEKKEAAPAKKPAAKGKAASKKKGASAAATPSKLGAPSSSYNLSDPSISHGDRMRALRAKLAAQREQALQEFQEKYGVEGDEETAEERANAQRKGTGEASDQFLASQEEGQIARAPMMGSLTIKGAESASYGSVRRGFTLPRTHGSMTSEAKKLIAERQKMPIGRRLGMRLRIGAGLFGAFKTLEMEEENNEVAIPPPPVVMSKEQEQKAKPDGFQPLTIWTPTPEELAINPKLTTIEVPMLVAKWLRPHQREGVKFMCECVLGQRNLTATPQTTPAMEEKIVTNADGTTTTTSVPAPIDLYSLQGGAILADDMGLGKTLQSVALVYTLLTQGFESGHPVARKVIIVTPTSLVSNWNNELDKWLGKGMVNTVALSEVGKENISCGIDSFVGRGSKHHCLIISYDTFRRNVERLNKPGFCDLLICDEAHRLKNNKTSTYTALDSLPCRRRVLLSGTPMQNDLSEFFSMINFTNRNIIGDRKCFRKYYEMPILLGREPDCLESDAAEGSERSSELSAIVNQFVLRRTNVLLRQHLPPKVIQVVCCRPSDLQVKLYQHFLKSKSIKKLTGNLDEASEDRGGRGGGGLQALPLITSLKKLCNHPKLIWDTLQACKGGGGGSGKKTINEETGQVEKIPSALLSIFKGLEPIFQSHDNGAFVRQPSDPRFSGKMFVLERLLTQVRISNVGDRIVIVSNFTSALDVIAAMCTMKKWDFLRLDGSTSIKKRQQLVDQLSDHRGNRVFVFLLSSRAGGCGLNLIGANRLILFDPDWNPAVDKQAAARVWRDGQQRRCFVYRFLTTGSIEEKVYQRQLSKEGLSGVLGGSTADASLTKDELKNLFTLDEKSLEEPSDTHKGLECDCLDRFSIKTEAEASKAEEQQAKDAEEQKKQVEQEREKEKAFEAEQAALHTGEEKKTTVIDDVDDAGDVKMDDVEPGAPPTTSTMEIEGQEESKEGGNNELDPPSSSEDEEMDGFIANDSDDGDGGGSDGEDYGSKKKSSKAKAKKPSKKDGPRKQRKQRAVVGSLNYSLLHAMQQCTLGQRGEPPEEELINWAHHASSNSIPDPLFRVAAKTMPFTRGNLPFVSFVFSCEVSGKAILNSTDAVDAEKVSSRSKEAPTAITASKPITMSLEQAKNKHAEFMKNETAKAKKRQGNDEVSHEERLADPSKRRHSSRNAPKIQDKSHVEEEENDDDRAFIANDDDDDGGDDEAEGGGETSAEGAIASSSGEPGAPTTAAPKASKKRKAAPKAADIDDASLKLIQQIMQQEAGIETKRGRKPKKQAASPKRGKKKQQEVVEEQQVEEDNAMTDIPTVADDVASVAAASVTSESTTPAVSPQKKRKTDTGAVVDPPQQQQEQLQYVAPPFVAPVISSVASPPALAPAPPASTTAASKPKKQKKEKKIDIAAMSDDDFMESSDNDSVQVLDSKPAPKPAAAPAAQKTVQKPVAVTTPKLKPAANPVISPSRLNKLTPVKTPVKSTIAEEDEGDFLE